MRLAPVMLKIPVVFIHKFLLEIITCGHMQQVNDEVISLALHENCLLTVHRRIFVYAHLSRHVKAPPSCCLLGTINAFEMQEEYMTFRDRFRPGTSWGGQINALPSPMSPRRNACGVSDFNNWQPCSVVITANTLASGAFRTGEYELGG